MKRGQHVGLLLHIQILVEVERKVVGIRAQFLCNLCQSMGFFLDNLAHVVSIGIFDLEGVIATHATNAAGGFGSNSGKGFTAFSFHDVERGGEYTT